MSLLPRSRTLLRAGVLPVLALALLAACRKEGGGGGGGGGKWTVGFSQMGHDNPWRMAQTASLRAEAQKRGYDIVVTDAQDQTAKQVADV
jgi:ribose transport system substrate-binding protein